MGEARQDKFRVIVGVDFSEASHHAIHEAMQLARLMPRVELNFVHVMETSPELHDAELIDALSDSLGQAMARLERHVRDALFIYGADAGWGIPIAYHVRVGPIARELHQTAVDVDAEMIVVGKNPSGGLRKLFHRSAAEELVRTAQVPVVVAHPKDFRGMRKSEVPDPPRADQDVTESGIYATTDAYENGPRAPHIAGLI